MPNFLDFIEIGTSDFDTEIQKASDITKGISIEPIQYYIDRLPNRANVSKLNIAISDFDGISTIYYTPEHIIQKYNLPDYVRGCNSVNTHHPVLIWQCHEKGLNIHDVMTSYSVPTKKLSSVFRDYNIDGVYYLKVDTEGHDPIILGQFFCDIQDNSKLPHIILFESNVLSNKSDINYIIDCATKKGYDIVYSDINTQMRLNLHKVSREGKAFSYPCIGYYICAEYSINYDPLNPPHANTLESAMDYCAKNMNISVVYCDGRYEVRNGAYLVACNNNQCTTWILL